MNELEFTGGARIGMANATWPLATLKVSKDLLELNASILGKFSFQPKDIVSIEPYKKIPLLGQGIKINHRIANYNSNVIFWTSKDSSSLINQIKQLGFLENIDSKISDGDELIIKEQPSGGFPIKSSVAIGIIALWNILLISDIIKFYNSDRKGMPFGIGVASALASILLISLFSLISKDFSKLILKEGKSIKDINNFLYFLIFVSASMLIKILTF
jgi:hypothetical protein